MLSTLPEDTAFSRMVDIAKLCWRIERDYEELKQEVGLGHFEGRGWRGFHHHATLCIATYGFLVSERGDDSPLRAKPNGFLISRSSIRGCLLCGLNAICRIQSRHSAAA
jgi:hypothetical protein